MLDAHSSIFHNSLNWTTPGAHQQWERQINCGAFAPALRGEHWGQRPLAIPSNEVRPANAAGPHTQARWSAGADSTLTKFKNRRTQPSCEKSGGGPPRGAGLFGCGSLSVSQHRGWLQGYVQFVIIYHVLYAFLICDFLYIRIIQ